MVILTMKELSRESLSAEEGAEKPSRKVNIKLKAVCCVKIFIVVTMGFLRPTKMLTLLQENLAVFTSVTGMFLGVHGSLVPVSA